MRNRQLKVSYGRSALLRVIWMSADLRLSREVSLRQQRARNL